MKPFDVHCHLYDESFNADRVKVIEKARKVLSGIVVVGEGPKTNRKVLTLCKNYSKFLFPGLAIHPDHVWKLSDKEITNELKFISEQKNLVCIGECGLDYKWAPGENSEESKERQKAVFIKQIELARKLDLPLNVHSRRATSDVVKILKENRAKKVILHGFVTTPEEARKATRLGYKITIGTTLLWKDNNRHLIYYLENFPLSTFVLETDSPVLAPIRGMRNEPSNISLVVKEIAKIKKIPEDKIIEITNKNVRELFKL
ncbi:MAG: TatD family hydrolase [Candidatus Nanoarchaeia archaeon]